MGTPWGSGNGDDGNLIWWIGTPAGAVDAGPELTGGGGCSGAPSAAEAARGGGCHCSQGGAVDGSCSGPAGTPWGSGSCGGAPGVAEAAGSGGCHCSQGGAVDGSYSGPSSTAEASWCSGCHGSHGGAVAAMGRAAGCGP
nr:keratin-associated protein 5-4-like [Aegilops tauschii subsp. strangulata]